MILGLDISTSITGYTILDHEGDILVCDHIDLRKEKNFFNKIQMVNARLEDLEIGNDLLGGLLVIPEVRHVHLFLQRFALLDLDVVVKESHGWSRSAPRGLQRPPCEIRNAWGAKCKAFRAMVFGSISPLAALHPRLSGHHHSPCLRPELVRLDPWRIGRRPHSPQCWTTGPSTWEARGCHRGRQGWRP